MHITPQSQPSFETIHRTFVTAIAMARTLLAYAQAADWNGRTLTFLLITTWLCHHSQGRFEKFQTSVVCPARWKFLRLRIRMARMASYTASLLSRRSNRGTPSAAV